MKIILYISAISFLLLILLSLPRYIEASEKEWESMKKFLELSSDEWTLMLYDSCTQDWKKNWTLDGIKAKVKNNNYGMDFWAGPTPEDDASHAVIWTKQSFSGDVKIEYEYTRLDEASKYVTILYIQATGSNLGPYKKDIFQWGNLRDVPAMKKYFDHMNTYHISYAVNTPAKDYIRARRYLPEAKKGLTGTSLKPDYFNTGLFQTGVIHKITVIKKKNEIYMFIRNNNRELLCHWTNKSLPNILEGRIGLRHMYTRGARYSNFKVYSLHENTEKTIPVETHMFRN